MVRRGRPQVARFEVELVRRWHKEGKPIGEIAELLDRTYVTVKKHVNTKSSRKHFDAICKGVHSRRRYLAEFEGALISRLHKKGKPIGHIAKLLNRNYKTVKRSLQSFVKPVRPKYYPALGATSHCEVCETTKPSVDFDANVLHHAKYHGRHCVCLACRTDGYSPRDIRSYPCTECGLKGHLKFARHDLKKYKKPRRRANLVCADCIAKLNKLRKKLYLRHRWGCTYLGKCNNPGRVRDRMQNGSDEDASATVDELL